jgi:hypothetical protein
MILDPHWTPLQAGKTSVANCNGQTIDCSSEIRLRGHATPYTEQRFDGPETGNYGLMFGNGDPSDYLIAEKIGLGKALRPRTGPTPSDNFPLMLGGKATRLNVRQGIL